MTNKIKYFLILCGIFSSIGLSFSADNKKQNLSYADLEKKYSLMGPLGYPLGKVLELEVSKVEDGSKENPPLLKVLAVNGKKLTKPVICRYAMFIIADKFQLGKVMRIKAYQDGGFEGTPDEVLKEIMVQSKSYHFEIRLVVFAYK